MTKTIAQLWNGTLEPIHSIGQDNPEIKQLESIMQRNLEKLEKTLHSKHKDMLKIYNDAIEEYIGLISEQAFCDGFCLGTKIVVEALTGAEKGL